jgi:hypothetical protein
MYAFCLLVLVAEGAYGLVLKGGTPSCVGSARSVGSDIAFSPTGLLTTGNPDDCAATTFTPGPAAGSVPVNCAPVTGLFNLGSLFITNCLFTNPGQVVITGTYTGPYLGPAFSASFCVTVSHRRGALCLAGAPGPGLSW